jgi:hypothetical protein
MGEGMRGIGILALVALAGWVGPPPPSQAEVALQSACNSGDVSACQTIVEIQQRERERISAIPPPVLVDQRVDPSIFMNNRPAPPLNTGMKVCPNGQIVQQFYFC